VNKVRPIVTKAEQKEQHNTHNRQYMKEYAKLHKQEKQLYDKKHRELNKEKIHNRYHTVHECPCGCTYTGTHRARHERTAQHVRWEKTNVDGMFFAIERMQTEFVKKYKDFC
jgi:hypothetical protein